MANRLYELWQHLDEHVECRPVGVAGGVAGARALFIDFVRAGCPRGQWAPLVPAGPPVRECMSPLRALAALCTKTELEEFLALVQANSG
jgi:hypothetical protein